MIMDMAYMDAVTRSSSAAGVPRVWGSGSTSHAADGRSEETAAVRSHARVEAVLAPRELVPDYAEIRARVLSSLPGVPDDMREVIVSYLGSSPQGVALPPPGE